MPELGTYGSVRGVPGNGHPYRDHRTAPARRRVSVELGLPATRLLPHHLRPAFAFGG